MNGFSKVLLLFILITGRAAFASDQAIDFARDVEPVLTQHCAQCHGAMKQRGGFRVDSRSSLIGEADSGEPAIVPNESRSSELIRRIESTDDGEWMPPEGPRLSAEEIDKLKRWIDAGAEWPDAANVKTSTSEIVPTPTSIAILSFELSMMTCRLMILCAGRSRGTSCHRMTHVLSLQRVFFLQDR